MSERRIIFEGPKSELRGAFDNWAGDLILDPLTESEVEDVQKEYPDYKPLAVLPLAKLEAMEKELESLRRLRDVMDAAYSPELMREARDILLAHMAKQEPTDG